MISIVNDSFVRAVSLMAACAGSTLATGAGTSGAVAQRFAHLLATCSLRAFFVHPSDALHGASARIASGDVLVVFSKAGKSQDINGFAEIARKRGARIIAITWEEDSKLARLSDVVCITKTEANARSESVLPFGSTIAAAAYSDPLCSALNELSEFDISQLKETHPWGGTPELL
jgi:arabinose-5-phosphate isomerase